MTPTLLSIQLIFQIPFIRSLNCKRQLEVSNDTKVKTKSQKLEIKGVKQKNRRNVGGSVKRLPLNKASNSQEILYKEFPTLGHTSNEYNNKTQQ